MILIKKNNIKYIIHHMSSKTYLSIYMHTCPISIFRYIARLFKL